MIRTTYVMVKPGGMGRGAQCKEIDLLTDTPGKIREEINNGWVIKEIHGRVV